MENLSRHFKGGAMKSAMLMGLARSQMALASALQPTEHKGFTTNELIAANASLMTGPKASRPSWRAVRKTILRMRSGLSVKGSWRSWPALKVGE